MSDDTRRWNRRLAKCRISLRGKCCKLVKDNNIGTLTEIFRHLD
jgi:hypothetical protein